MDKAALRAQKEEEARKKRDAARAYLAKTVSLLCCIECWGLCGR